LRCPLNDSGEQTGKPGALFFNNHVWAQAPENAQRLITLLKEQGLMVASPENALFQFYVTSQKVRVYFICAGFRLFLPVDINLVLAV